LNERKKGAVMKAATHPRVQSLENKLLAIDAKHATLHDLHLKHLPTLIEQGDLVVVNDAATLPASLFAVVRNGTPIELRLVARQISPEDDERWRVVLFGDGDWHTPTERRSPPVRLEIGETIAFTSDLSARVVGVSPVSPRLVDVSFRSHGDAFWRALYAHGRPIQYSYLDDDLRLESVQTGYAARPWAMEMPSAGRPLTWSLIFGIIERGARVRSLTHAAGLSSTGDPEIDAALPFEESFEIPAPTAQAIEETRSNGGRVFAVGTTVVRALEGAALESGGIVRPGRGTTDLKIDGGFRPKIVQGVLTGVHERTASHSALLEAFASKSLLDEAASFSDAHGYLGHEFGDSWLIYEQR
jgi:S-adenosylmethionine:tRNA ribosyltransferase-isomerase